MYRFAALLAIAAGLNLGFGDDPVPISTAAKPKLIAIKTVDVSATEFKFEPADISANAGDTLRFLQSTATPHNVEFKSSPAGASLGAAKMGPFMAAAGEKYDVVLGSGFPAGKYSFACTPHESMGMKGTLTIAAGK
jgi:plastocyanin